MLLTRESLVEFASECSTGAEYQPERNADRSSKSSDSCSLAAEGDGSKNCGRYA